MEKKVDVWYLGHSGFAIGIADTLLIFDYYLDQCEGIRALTSGVIVPEEITQKKVLVFSSHRHPDHFNPIILSWKEKLPQTEFFLSSDIPKKFYNEWTHVLKPYQVYENEGLKIQTYKSTDEGVAFLVTLYDITLYHAGDLNWWHWDEESADWNNDMAARYKHEVSLIKDIPIDIAFLTADPRQESAELLGITYFLEQVETGVAFPMHFGDDYSIMNRIVAESDKNLALNKIIAISERGQYFSLTI